MTFLFYTSIVLFLILCFLLSVVVLVQESKSLGLGASFGGDAGDSLFGTSTAQVLKTITAWMGCIFILSCIVLSVWSESLASVSAYLPQTEQSPISE
jgi:preprotein translocase subunit SecG